MYKTAFERYEEAKRNTSPPEQCLQYQQKLFLNELYQKQEKERLIEEITDRVYKRIAVSTDTLDTIKRIKELEKEIDNLTKMFK